MVRYLFASALPRLRPGSTGALPLIFCTFAYFKLHFQLAMTH